MSRRHADIRSHPGHHLVDPYTWPSDHFWLRYSKFHIWPWKFKVKPHGHIWGLEFNRYVCFSFRGNWTIFCWHIAKVKYGMQHAMPFTLKIQGQGHGQGQTPWSHLRPWVQSICLLFVSWQSDHFWLRYNKFHVWPWKFKVMVKVKVKPNGRIWGPEFYRDITNSMFDLENSRSRSWSRSNPMVAFEDQSSIDMFAFRFVAIGPFLADI